MHKKIRRQEERTAYMFIAPFLLGALIFSLIPIVYALVISFMDYNSLKPLSEMTFIGLANYIKILGDQVALEAYGKALLYSSIFVPLKIIVSFFIAILLNRRFLFKTVSRTMIFMPYASNVVSIAVVMTVLLNPYDGILNTLLRLLGWENPPLWLGGVDTVIPTIAGIAVWHGLTFSTIVYLAALQGVPKDLYEAASMDGAGIWTKIRHITMPLVSPTTFFLVITMTITSLQNFAVIKLFSNGGPGTASRVISFNIYQEAFTYNHFSYATAQAVVLFLFILALTIIQWKGQKKWVHY